MKWFEVRGAVSLAIAQFIHKHFPRPFVQDSFEYLAVFDKYVSAQREWPMVKERVVDSILRNSIGPQRVNKIMGADATILLTIATIVEGEFVRLGPRYQVMDGPKMLASLREIGQLAIDMLYNQPSDAPYDEVMGKQELEESYRLTARFNKAMDAMAKQFLKARGREYPVQKG